MLKEIILAIVQAITEFLPISSSGHLMFFSTFISNPNLPLFTLLHLSSLIAILIFTRKELKKMIFLEGKYKKWWLYLFVATIPAALFGFLFNEIIENSFNNFLLLSIFFLFNGSVLFLTKNKKGYSKINYKRSILTGLVQVLALFPGISRSGMTISSLLFQKTKKEEAMKFAFLMYIPLAIGAFILEVDRIIFNPSIIVAFFICIVFSIIMLYFLEKILEKGNFWVFSIYCWFIGIVSLLVKFFIL